MYRVSLIDVHDVQCGSPQGLNLVHPHKNLFFGALLCPLGNRWCLNINIKYKNSIFHHFVLLQVVVDILEHCTTVHELNHQYKCAFCTFSSNNKVQLYYISFTLIADPLFFLGIFCLFRRIFKIKLKILESILSEVVL